MIVADGPLQILVAGEPLGAVPQRGLERDVLADAETDRARDSLALAARRRGAPRAQWILIGLAALFLLGGHPRPFGTIAFASLFVAALLRERQVSRAARHSP